MTTVHRFLLIVNIFQTKLVVEKIGNTGLTEIPFIPLTKDACNIYSKYFKKVWINILTNMKVENPHMCPLPAVSKLN